MTTLADLRARFGPAPTTTAADVRAARHGDRRSVLVVLDDDPTGTQSVCDLPVLTGWSPEDLGWAFAQGVPAVYVMTNSRSLDPAEAEACNREVARAALAAAAEHDVDVVFVSRGDSTLRGHFPLEPDTLVEEVLAAGGPPVDAVLVVPAFPDAGRVTVDRTHYCVTRDEDDGSSAEAVPAGDTEFARDATFGYESSDLAAWVEEKTAGRTPADQVLHVDLGTIRDQGPEGVATILNTAVGAVPVVVDMLVEEDLRVVALGIELARKQGKHFVHRVGPPFVRAVIGQEPRSPLSAADVYGDAPADGSGATPGESGTHGLLVVGSHVGMTSRQLADLHASDVEVVPVELDVAQVLEDSTRGDHLRRVVDDVVAGLGSGTTVLSTSRTLVTGSTPQESLQIARTVSGALVHVVAEVVARRAPRFVIAKGGITSSDVASRGLGMARAVVRGPMLPGIVSLWEPQDGPGAGIPYVVFAGNVGSTSSLTDVVRTLSNGTS